MAGVILPQLIQPVAVIVYKQFFDSVPRDFREAAKIDGANHAHLLFRIFLPMNWGVTAALAIITFIGAWNAFLWPFLVTVTKAVMTVAVVMAQVQELRRQLRLRCSPARAGRAAGGPGLSDLPAPRNPGDHSVGRHQGLTVGKRTQRPAGSGAGLSWILI